MNPKPFQNAFGKPDGLFIDNVHRRLAELNRRKRPRLWLIGVAAAACMTLAATAFALTNAWGLLDFLGRRYDVRMLPEAVGIITDDVPQTGGQAEWASFSVRQAVCDGSYAYVVVEARPAADNILLCGTDLRPSDPIANCGPLFAGLSGTVGEYARANGKTLFHTSVWDESPDVLHSLDFILEDDGTLVYMLSGAYESEPVPPDGGLSFTLQCTLAPFVDGGDQVDTDNIQRTALSFTLEAADALWTAGYAEPVLYADCGVIVERITLTATPMAVYAQIAFSVADAEKFAATDGGLWFELIDENGDRLPDGAAGSWSIEQDGDGFIQRSAFAATQTQPAEIILRAYNCWDKQRYEAHAIELR